MKKELRQYYLAIRSLLPCCWKRKNAFIRTLDSSIAAYISEHPDADFTQIERHFGTPQQIAASYIEEMDPQEITDKLKVRKRILQIVVSAVFLCALVWLILLAVAFLNELNSADGFYSGVSIICD